MTGIDAAKTITSSRFAQPGKTSDTTTISVTDGPTTIGTGAQGYGEYSNQYRQRVVGDDTINDVKSTRIK